MEKLELKHLAPYLPYRLNLLVTSNDICTIGDSYNRVYKGNKIGMDCKELEIIVDFQYEHLKPILRPLSDLTKAIKHNGKNFIPLAEILISIPEADFRFKNYKNTVIECWNYSNDDSLKFYLPPIIGMNEYKHIQKLFEWHFDVFGLIEKGLAIDINTL